MVNKPEPPLALSPAQVDCLSSPVRAEIVRMLSLDGSLSVRELAGRLGRSVTRLYHHMAVLRNAGLVGVCGRGEGRRNETAYRLVAGRLSSSEAVKVAEGRAALAKAARRFLATAARRFAEALDRPEFAAAGEERIVSLRQIRARLVPATLARLNADLDTLAGRYGSIGEAGGMALTVTMVVVPEPEFNPPA